MDNIFYTQVSNLADIEDKRFIIPSYQRPYVWGDEQINKLLSDFFDAYCRDDENYFIGTVLTSLKNDVNELIDGQQRFTTLWLIAVSFKILGIQSSLTHFLKAGNDLRFDFAIRRQLKSYLLSLLEKTKTERNQYSDTEVESDEYLINVAKAVTTITKKVETFDFPGNKTASGFGDYIYQHISFVKNTAPPKTNLNKLFATINNSGVQLEQSDILKSRLLNLISKESQKESRVLYSKIWEACENMENYFERNVRQLFPETEWIKINSESFSKFDEAVFKYNREQLLNEKEINNLGLSIPDIINDIPGDSIRLKLNKSGEIQDEDDEEKIYCKSIINFPQLLLHTYRVFLARNGKNDFEHPFHIKYLLEIFKPLEKESESTIRDFFYCLWKVRFVFDKYVIKWVQKPEDKEDELKITTVSWSDKSGNRFFSRTQPDAKEASSMLQSVLYFTGNYNTQIWLSPFLKRLLDGEGALGLLENIDNILSLSLEEDKIATYHLMKPDYMLVQKLDFAAYLHSAAGTSFKHYWFQKLEFILWKQWKDKNDPKFKEYRITSKNSVEHVFPQNHEFKLTLEDEYLNCFGNLGLLSVSQNSSYSNQSIVKKKDDFDNKLTYDSLKLALIYSNRDVTNWGVTQIKNHQEEMIDKIKEHYNFILP